MLIYGSFCIVDGGMLCHVVLLLWSLSCSSCDTSICGRDKRLHRRGEKEGKRRKIVQVVYAKNPNDKKTQKALKQAQEKG